MILYLLRHGQTNGNVEERIQGHIDEPLNGVGIGQIKKVAEKLSDFNISVIYTSDLKRAKKSADIIATALDVPVHYTKKLRELNFGKAEGYTKSSLESAFPYIFQAFNDIKNPERYNVSYPNGETIGNAQQRLTKFINKLLDCKDENVLLVSHGMLIRLFVENCFKKTIKLENAQVLRVILDKKTKKVKSAKILF